MLKYTNNILLALVFVGLGAIGGWFVRDWFCADTSEAIIKQLEEDNRKLAEAKAEVKVKEVYRDKIRTVIKTVPAGECFDSPIPAVAAPTSRAIFNPSPMCVGGDAGTRSA